MVISKETAELIGAVCTGSTLTSGMVPTAQIARTRGRTRTNAHARDARTRPRRTCTRAGDFLLQSTTSALSSHVVTRKDKLRSLSTEQVCS